MASLSGQRVVQNGLPQNFLQKPKLEFFCRNCMWIQHIHRTLFQTRKKKAQRQQQLWLSPNHRLTTMFANKEHTEATRKPPRAVHVLDIQISMSPCPFLSGPGKPFSAHGFFMLAHELLHGMMSLGVFCTSVITGSMAGAIDTAIPFWVFFSRLNRQKEF